METRDLDLNAILDQARKESFQAGFNAALQEMARFINARLGKSLEGISIPRRSADRRPRLIEGSLTALVLNKIEAHPDGIFAIENQRLGAIRKFAIRRPSGRAKTCRYGVNTLKKPLQIDHQKRRWEMVSGNGGFWFAGGSRLDRWCP